jgi:hypothetical protein
MHKKDEKIAEKEKVIILLEKELSKHRMDVERVAQ